MCSGYFVLGIIPKGGPASEKLLNLPSTDKIKGGSCPALDNNNSFLLESYIPINIVTNIPLDMVSQISLFNWNNKSDAEKFVLLKHLYKLDALDIKSEDFIPFPDTSATPNPYLPLPRSEKL